MPESLKWDGEKYDCKPGLAGWKKFKELLVTNSARADPRVYFAASIQRRHQRRTSTKAKFGSAKLPG